MYEPIGKKVNVFETVHFSNFSTLQFWVIPSRNIGNKKQLGPWISFVNVFGVHHQKVFTINKLAFTLAILNAIMF